MATEDINFEVTGFGQLRQQLREAQLEMIKLAEAGKSGTAEFAAAARKAGELREAIGDASDAATVFQDGGKFKAAAQGLGLISSGFGAIQGAAAIAGGDVKQFQETMVKLQSAIAITNFFESFAEIGDIFKKLKLAAIDTFTTLKAQIGSTGIGLLIIGIGVAVQQLVSYLGELSDAEKANAAETKQLQNALEGLSATYNSLNLDVEAATALQLAQATTAGSSEAEMTRIKKEGIQKRIDLIDQEVKVQIQLYAKLQDALAKNGKTAEENALEREKLNQQQSATGIKLGTEKFKLEQQLLIEDENLKQKNQANSKKRSEENKQREKDERDRKVKALDEQKKLDLALLESEKLVKLGQAKSEEEKIALQQVYYEKALAIDSTYQINKATIIKSSAKDLQATLQENDNKSLAMQQDTADKLLELAKQNKEKTDQEAEKDKRDKDQKAKEDLARALQKIEDEKNLRDIASEQTIQDQFDLDNALYESETKALDAKLALYQEGSSEYIAVQKEIADREVEIEKQKQDAKKQLQQMAIDTATGLLDDLKSLNQNYDKDNEEAAKKAFEREKALSIVSTLISTYAAAQKAYASQLIIGDPTSLVRAQIAAVLAVVGGLARVAVISQQQFQFSSSSSSSSTAKSAPTPSTYEEGGMLQGRSHDLGGIRTSLGELEGGEFVVNRRATANFLPLLESINSLGNTRGPEVPMASQTPIIKTYVVASDMTSQQEANARLSALSRL